MTTSDQRRPVDELPVIQRREVEARIAGPLLKAFAQELGEEKTLEIARQVIVRLAEESGRERARAAGGNTLAHLAASGQTFQAGGALETAVLEQGASRYAFNVMRCRYAEMYRALGIPELGSLLSCGRDFAMIRGFNPSIKLRRTQTIMEGAPFCDFRFTLEQEPPAPPPGRERP